MGSTGGNRQKKKKKKSYCDNEGEKILPEIVNEPQREREEYREEFSNARGL